MRDGVCEGTTGTWVTRSGGRIRAPKHLIPESPDMTGTRRPVGSDTPPQGRRNAAAGHRVPTQTEEATPGRTAKGARAAPVLNQDPHTVKPPRERNLQMAIGREIRASRLRQSMTVAALARATGLSVGMLSKIENGLTSPSLSTLQTVSNALSTPLTAFFRLYEETRAAQHLRAGEHVETTRRGTRAGHQYNLLGHLGSNRSGVVVEPYLITLTTSSDIFPAFQHEGLELLYMLEGEVVYRHGTELYHLRSGDTLFFEADAQHGPEELVSLPARYLSIIAYPQS